MSDNIRNFAFISHGGAGKTTLTEMFLHNSGKIKEPGKVENGNTKSDFTPEEKDHKYSIVNSYFSFPWEDYKINLIDTPGYADFRGEVASALRMVEGAVLLIDGSSGIQVNTGFVWKIARDNDLARFVMINKMDKEGAEFRNVFNEINETYEENFVPMTIPCKDGDEYVGVIDLLRERFIKQGSEKKSGEEIPEEYSELAEEFRLELIEATVELDDELMMKYLEDEEITDKELTQALYNGVKNRELVPVFAGAAVLNSGVVEMMNYLGQLVPSPFTHEVVTGKTAAGEEVEIEIAEDGPFVALVGKTMVDPYIGKLSIFRLLSGSLNREKEIYVPRLDSTFKTNKFYKLNGEEQETVEEIEAGEIGAIAKIDDLETSDTLCSEDVDIVLPDIEFPVPMLQQAAQPASEGDEEKMSTSLHRISQEDPTFQVEYNKETKELLVTAMGSVHMSVIKDLCKRKFDVDFVTSIPRVAYKETIQTKADVEEKYKKQSGGRGQYGHVFIKFEPLPRGQGFEFEEEIFGGAIPNQYIPAVEKGIREAKEDGVLAGYPVVDFKATVYDGSYHSVDSSEMAFKIAASKAFKKALKDAKPVLLEPIMEVKVIVPEDYMGDIMGDLNSRRGKIMGMDPQNGKQIIKAQVPQGEMFSYASDLKSITGGYGKFEMEFSHYDKVPSKESEEIIAEAQKEE